MQTAHGGSHRLPVDVWYKTQFENWSLFLQIKVIQRSLTQAAARRWENSSDYIKVLLASTSVQVVRF